jgi:hypothetical protein
MTMAEVIDIELSAGGINRAIRSLRAMKKDLRKTADDIVKETAQYATNMATAYYQGYMGDSIPWVEMIPYSNNHGYHVVATGEEATVTNASGQATPVGNTVMFAEFGAGTATDESSPFAIKLGVKQGSFSSTVGTGEFAETGVWHHGYDPETGEAYEYTNIKGTNAMYKASQDAREKIKDLIREKFK